MLNKAIPAACAAALSLAGAGAADAQVMEVGAEGAHWVGAAGTDAGAVPSVFPSALEPSERATLQGVPDRWRDHVNIVAAKYNLSPDLIEALVWQESRWHPEAVSPAGARGLTQLMPATARQLGVDPQDPLTNLEGGARYLRMQLDLFDGDVERALAAYNAGPGRVQRAGGVPAIRETQMYVASIMARLTHKLGD